MTPSQIDIQLVAAITAAACALPGVWLVLRRMAMMGDAISHTVLLGIVLAFIVTRNLHSPLLFVGAVLIGVITVVLVELLQHTRLVKEDAAIGLVFPVLFSIAVIIISVAFSNVHLDENAVLLGELAFVPFDRVELFGFNLPRTLVIMSGILLLNLALITIFYKELKLVTFDAGLATSLGFAPALIHYGLMTMVSITAVGAFDAVGSILVIALIVAPPISAYLLTDRLVWMLILSVMFGIASAISGYWVAWRIDTTISGAIAMMAGVFFGMTYLLAPQRGLIAVTLRRLRQRREFAQTMLALHLFNHEDQPDAISESRFEHLYQHMRWQPVFATRVVRRAEQRGLIRNQAGVLLLTERGRQMARQSLLATTGADLTFVAPPWTGGARGGE